MCISVLRSDFFLINLFQNLLYFKGQKSRTNFRDSYFEYSYAELKYKLFKVQKPGKYLTADV